MATQMEEEGEVPEAAAPASAPVGSGKEDAKTAGASPADADDDEVRLQAAEQALKQCPGDYEANVEYIQCLRKSGNIEKLREARKRMNLEFPLTPKMWQEWVKDEISLNTSGESFEDIEKLFERGVQEYLSVDLWLYYLYFVAWHDQSVAQYSPAVLAKMRDLFERAITAGGFHVAEGSKLWVAYRKYEMSILLITVARGNEEEQAKQVQRIRTLFHRQLSVPLADMESTLAEYKSWEAEQGNENDQDSDFDGVPLNVISAYKKANDMYNERKQYEDQLSKTGASEDDKLQEFLVPSILKNVYHRATRNFPGVAELWVRYLLSLERIHASEKELKRVFERARQYPFDTEKEYLDIYLTRVDSLRRRMSDGLELDFQLIRETFMDAGGFECPTPFLEAEDLLLVCSYWTKLECNLGNGVAAARQIWEDALTANGFVLKIWKHYILMEIEMGNINRARSLYKRCYSRRFADSESEDICNAWISFEKEYGTSDDYDLAMEKVNEHCTSKAAASASASVVGDTEDQPSGSEGRASAKRRRSWGADDTSSGIEVLQRMNERGIALEGDEKMVQEEQGMLQNQKTLLKLEESVWETKVQALTEELSFSKKLISLLREQLQIREERLEQEKKLVSLLRERLRISEENAIMNLDLDKVIPSFREYYTAKRNEILARYGITIPSTV